MHQPIELPPRVFLYTLDQLAYMTSMEISTLKLRHLYFTGRHTGPVPKRKMKAIDVSTPEDAKPDWRVSEEEFKRWLRHKGFRVYDRTTVY